MNLASAWLVCGNSSKWRERLVWLKSARGPERAFGLLVCPRGQTKSHVCAGTQSKLFSKIFRTAHHIENTYWDEAVALLTEDDKRELQNIITHAFEKLSGNPIQVPHEEHRRLHLLIYSRLNNPFVAGLLEAYWEAYESVGLNMYAGGMDYLEKVWGYHKTMVQSICNGNYAAGRKALVTHIDLFAHRPL